MSQPRELMCSICEKTSRVRRNKFKFITTAAVEHKMLSAYRSVHGHDPPVPLIGTPVHKKCYHNLYERYHYKKSKKSIITSNEPSSMQLPDNSQYLLHSNNVPMFISTALSTDNNDSSIKANKNKLSLSLNDKNLKLNKELIVPLEKINLQTLTNVNTDQVQSIQFNAATTCSLPMLQRERNILIGAKGFLDSSTSFNINTANSLQQPDLLPVTKNTNNEIEITAATLLSMMIEMVVEKIDIRSKYPLIFSKLVNDECFSLAHLTQSQIEVIPNTETIILPTKEQTNKLLNLDMPLLIDSSSTSSTVLQASKSPTDNVHEEASVIEYESDQFMNTSIGNRGQCDLNCFNDLPTLTSLLEENQKIGFYDIDDGASISSEDSSILTSARYASSPIALGDNERLNSSSDEINTFPAKLTSSRKLSSRCVSYKRKIGMSIRRKGPSISRHSQMNIENHYPDTERFESLFQSPIAELSAWLSEQVRDKLISLNTVKEKFKKIIDAHHPKKFDNIKLRNDWLQRQLQQHSPDYFWFGTIAKCHGTYVGLNNIDYHLKKLLSSSLTSTLSQSSPSPTVDYDDDINNQKKNLCQTLFTTITTLREHIRDNVHLVRIFNEEPEKMIHLTASSFNNLVPMLLRNFIGILTASDRGFLKIKREYMYFDMFDIDLFRNSHEWLKNISICFDIINVQNDRIVTPKHILLANEVYRHAHSYELLTVLNRYGVVCSHQNLSRLYHSIGKNDDTSASAIPTNVRNNCFMIEVHDNFDMNKETLRGEGSLHVVNRVILQTSENDGKLTHFSSPMSSNTARSSSQLSSNNVNVQKNILSSSSSANSALILSTLTNASDISATTTNHLSKPTSLYKEFQSSNHGVSLFCFDLVKSWFSTNYLNPSLLVPRHCTPIPLISGFFASYLSSSLRPIHHVTFLPPMHDDPNKTSTTYACMESTKQRLLDSGIQEVAVIVVDEKIYRNCIEVKENNKLLFNRVLPYPGEFHLMKNYMIVVWGILEGSGIDTALGELYKGASLRSIMNCSHFNKSLRAMKLLHSALAALIIHEFLSIVPREIFDDIEVIMQSIPLDVSTNTCKSAWFEKVQQVVQQHQLSVMFNEWVCPLIDMYIAIRSADFDSRNAALSRMAPLFFSTNHLNYARLCARHLTDLRSCSDELFNVLAKAFAVQRTSRPFSSIPMDQTIEVTINKAGKGHAGISGRYNKNMIDIWCRSFSYRSLLSTLTFEFAEYETDNDNIDAHIECSPSRLESDQHDFATLLNFFYKERLFTCEDETVTQLFFGQQFQTEIIDDILDYVRRGKVALEEFIKERFVLCSIPSQTSMNKMKLLKLRDNDRYDPQSGLVKRTPKKVIDNIKEIDEIIIKAIILSQYRPKINLIEFFGHEFSSRPISLCDRNNNDLMNNQNKSQVLTFFKKKFPESFSSIKPIDISSMPINECALLIDGGALLQTRPPSNYTVLDYAIFLLEKKIIIEFNYFDRIDIVFDSNRSYSIKSFIPRHKMINEQKCVYYKLLPEHKIPTGQQFDHILRSGNRAVLAAAVVQCWQLPSVLKLLPIHKKLVVGGPNATAFYLSHDLPPEEALDLESNHDEADTRLILHLQDAALTNYKTVIVRSADTDVVFLMISYANTINLTNLVVDATVRSGQGKYINCTMIHNDLINKYKIFPELLLVLHALTGCDTTSFFRNISKTKFFENFFADPRLYDDLEKLSVFPMVQEDIKVVERLIFNCIHHAERRSIIMNNSNLISYNLSNINSSIDTSFLSIDNIRAAMAISALRKGNKSIVLTLPPSSDALFHHCRRASRQYQIWRNAHIANIPYPELFGFENINNDIKIKWTTKNPLPEDNFLFHSCKCKGSCEKICKCGKYSQPCTLYCSCDATKCCNRSSISQHLSIGHAQSSSIVSMHMDNMLHDHNYLHKTNESIDYDQSSFDSGEDNYADSSDSEEDIILPPDNQSSTSSCNKIDLKRKDSFISESMSLSLKKTKSYDHVLSFD
ncbi:unnamed protein product [Rotaria sp. Silwood1]|nr:unnamed protein product [Rotaria sp. Silwood1]